MIFQNGELINGDFRKAKWPDGAYVVSDPPYNQDYHYGKYADRLKAAEYLALLHDAFGGDRSVVVHYPEAAINILPKAIIAPCEEVVSWVYNSNTSKQSRSITWWGCRPDFSKVGQPYKNPTDKRIAARIAAGKSARLYDWWYVDQVKNVSKADNPHPCPMPLEIMTRIVLTTTNPGDLVVDPFGGSGTTALACAMAGRRFVSYELDAAYHDYACRRMAEWESTILEGLI